jgi:hypothetical protein
MKNISNKIVLKEEFELNFSEKLQVFVQHNFIDNNAF